MEGSVRSTFDFYLLILLPVVTGRAHVGAMQWEVRTLALLTEVGQWSVIARKGKEASSLLSWAPCCLISPTHAPGSR